MTTGCRLLGLAGPVHGLVAKALLVTALVLAVGEPLTTVFVVGVRRTLDRANLLVPGRVCSPVAAVRIREAGAQSAADAPLAQSAERLHGKEKVYGSIP